MQAKGINATCVLRQPGTDKGRQGLFKHEGRGTQVRIIDCRIDETQVKKKVGKQEQEVKGQKIQGHVTLSKSNRKN